MERRNFLKALIVTPIVGLTPRPNRNEFMFRFVASRDVKANELVSIDKGGAAFPVLGVNDSVMQLGFALNDAQSGQTVTVLTCGKVRDAIRD